MPVRDPGRRPRGVTRSGRTGNGHLSSRPSSVTVGASHRTVGDQLEGRPDDAVPAAADSWASRPGGWAGAARGDPAQAGLAAGRVDRDQRGRPCRSPSSGSGRPWPRPRTRTAGTPTRVSCGPGWRPRWRDAAAVLDEVIRLVDQLEQYALSTPQQRYDLSTRLRAVGTARLGRLAGPGHRPGPGRRGPHRAGPDRAGPGLRRRGARLRGPAQRAAPACSGRCGTGAGTARTGR